MDADRGYSELYEDALRLAATVHRRQMRKGTEIPYVTHLVHVSVILMRHGFPIEVVVAGLLHDIVEDQGYSLREIRQRFGERVAEVVAALSEQKLDHEGRKRPWEARKREGLAHLRQASQAAVAVKAADTLHNARCTALDVRREGSKVWQRFTCGPEFMLSNYREILRVARDRLGDHALVDELADAVEDFARAIDEVGVAERGSPTPL